MAGKVRLCWACIVWVTDEFETEWDPPIVLVVLLFFCILFPYGYFDLMS